MPKLFNRFTHLKIDTLLASKALMVGFYRLPDEEKLRRVRHWLEDVSSIYGISTPNFDIGTEQEAHGSGVYIGPDEQIILPKFSILTLMHEFRHHMQSKGLVTLPRTLEAIEDDARAWSCSLFYSIKPKLFEKSVREGKIMYVKPEDFDEALCNNGDQHSGNPCIVCGAES